MKPKLFISIGKVYNPNSNSIGFLRLILALLVVIQHSFVLNGEKDPLSLHNFSNFGAIGVNGFFILSGYLITSSWLNNQNLLKFVWKRVLRIFPAFWICLLITAMVFAPIILVLSGGEMNIDFLKSQITYIYKNLFLIVNQADIGNLMSKRSEHSFNGSLWTLSWEFLFYICLAIGGILGFLSKRKTFIIAFIVCYIVSYFMSECKCTIFFKWYVSKSVAILPYMFGVGIIAFLIKDYLPNSFIIFTICLVAWVLDVKFNPHIPLHPFMLAYILLWLTVNLPFKSIEKYGDFSYGIYIYHFPMIQLLLFITTVHLSSTSLFFISILPTLMIAYFSWNFIEKPALSLKNHFNKREERS